MAIRFHNRIGRHANYQDHQLLVRHKPFLRGEIGQRRKGSPGDALDPQPTVLVSEGESANVPLVDTRTDDLAGLFLERPSPISRTMRFRRASLRGGASSQRFATR